ncbi:MAG: translation initiation factor [Polyangiales bacterium]
MKNNPFAKLASLREALPPGAAPEAHDAPKPVAAAENKAPPRAVLRYERKGRGGKEVTLIEQLALSEAELDEWCREARKALGCGGSVEGTAIALAGDQRKRLTEWLTRRGVKKVVGG